MKRKFLRWVLYILIRILTRLSVEGKANVPKEGPCLLTGNHLGIVDGPLIYCLLKRDDATGLVALKHKSHPIIRLIVDAAGGIWIDRTRTDFGALKEARKHLKKGGLLGLAPEGTRSDDHELIEAKPGVSFLADVSNAAILPTAITGAENSLKKINFTKFLKPSNQIWLQIMLQSIFRFWKKPIVLLAMHIKNNSGYREIHISFIL